MKPGEPHQHKHHLHWCSYPGAHETTSFPHEGRRGNHFARLYHAADSNPAARASLACLDPSRRCKPANLLRSERLPALPALAALPRWRSNGLSLEARGRQRKHRASYKTCMALARGHVSPTIPRLGTRLQGSRYATSLQQGSWKPRVPNMERKNIVFL